MAKSKSKQPQKVNVLGTEYTINFSTEAKDPELKGCSGYCLTSYKKIVIDEDIKHPDVTQKWVLRHELVHAFLYESGLDKEAPWSDAEEQIVDWIAIQFPKILKAIQEVDAI